MARPQQRLAANVEGPFCVDRTCIDCGTCWQFDPAHFAPTGSTSHVWSQPQGEVHDGGRDSRKSFGASSWRITRRGADGPPDRGPGRGEPDPAQPSRRRGRPRGLGPTFRRGTLDRCRRCRRRPWRGGGGGVGNLDGVLRARQPKRLPVVSTVAETRAVLQQLQGTEQLVAQMLYGSPAAPGTGCGR
ncbi:MAG: ferredoxin [Cyanobium sp. CZS 25K]|nr:ferredoxin [Cyanobium sp. CZS25K]